MKINSETKAIAIGTALGVAVGVALNNFALGLGIGILCSIGLLKRNKGSKEK